jgi:adrenodoxin-NADP+ reductase
VPLGVDGGVSVDILTRYYDGIVFAYGASKMRRLGIEGEDLEEVYSAGDFVGWYNGLPSHRHHKFNLDGENAVIIGHGNVALDVARILLTPPSILAKTDITNFALEELEKSRIRKVFIMGRRGVLQASFTVKELRELTNIPTVKFDATLPEGLSIKSREEKKQLPRIQERIVQLLRKAPITPNDVQKTCEIKFLFKPTRFLADNANHVTAVEFERQHLLDPASLKSAVEGTGELDEIKADVVFTAIGYTAVPLDGMRKIGPGVDVVRGVIPNSEGRVETTATKDFGYVESGAAMSERVPGVYVAGWVKTGPTGVIATTMYSAFETGDSLVADWNEGKPFLEPTADIKGWDGFKKEVESKGIEAVEWPGWKKIEAEETRRGELVGKEREKIVDIQDMLNISRQG